LRCEGLTLSSDHRSEKIAQLFAGRENPQDTAAMARRLEVEGNHDVVPLRMHFLPLAVSLPKYLSIFI
jgi:hypothetical protein